VISAGLKLDVYFGESLTTGRRMASDALMECFAGHGVEVAALYRGIEGFGIGRRIHTARFPDISTDLPLVAEAIDTRECSMVTSPLSTIASTSARTRSIRSRVSIASATSGRSVEI
jgi:PII-like signaling protein